jgi:hypothetical protein
VAARKPPPVCEAANAAVDAARSDARKYLRRVFTDLSGVPEVPEGDFRDWDWLYGMERWDAYGQLKDREPLSEEVRAYLLHLVSRDLGDPNSLDPPRGRLRNEVRDWWITRTIAAVVDHHGIRPTRNREPKSVRRPSACAIVAQVLGELGVNLGEHGVEEILRRRDRIRTAASRPLK